MQVPTPNLGKHVIKHPPVHPALSQLGGGGTTVQVPPEHVEPLPPHSASEQQADAQTQLSPCFT